MSADRHQHCVVFFQKLCRILNLCVHFDLHALLFDHFCFLCDDLSRQTIGRDSVCHHTANGRKRFFQCHVMSLFAQVICRCQTCRTCADYADFLSGIGKLFSFTFPVGSGIMICRIPFDVADRHCFVYFFSLTFQFTYMVADISQRFRERYFFTDHCRRRVKFPVFHMTDVTRYVGMRRTCMTTRNNGFFFLHFAVHQFVADRSGRTDFHTGSAKTAVRIFQQFVM